jgi:zinc protease
LKFQKVEASLEASKRAALAIAALSVVLFTVRTDYSSVTYRPQASPLVVPIIKRDSLLNGLQLMTLEQPGTGSVSAHLRINSGSLFDLAGKGGLADITAGMLLRGASGLSARSMADSVEQQGLTLKVTTGWDSTDIVITGPADSLEAILDLLGKLITSPAFDQKELDALKSSQVAALAKEGEDDSVLARRKALEVLFGSHPFGRPERGTPETIKQITRQDLVYFHNRFYIANNSEIIVSGDATADQVTRLARSKLGPWKKGEKVPPTFKPADTPAARRILVLDRAEEAPARAAFVQVGVSRRAEDYLATVVMADVLSSQISSLVAVHSGASLESDLEARLLAGPWVLSLKGAPADLAGYTDVIIDTMTRMAANLPANDRVETAKAKVVAAMAERLKTTEGAAELILDIETYGLGRDYVVNFADRVSAVSAADVQRAAQTHLKPQSMAIVIAGPASRFETAMKKVGAVTVQKQ